MSNWASTFRDWSVVQTDWVQIVNTAEDVPGFANVKKDPKMTSVLAGYGSTHL